MAPARDSCAVQCMGTKASAGLAARSRRPHERRQRRVALIVETGTSADVEIARAVILEGRQRGMLAENIGDALPGEGLVEAETLGDLRDNPPILPRLARRR